MPRHRNFPLTQQRHAVLMSPVFRNSSIQLTVAVAALLSWGLATHHDVWMDWLGFHHHHQDVAGQTKEHDHNQDHGHQHDHAEHQHQGSDDHHHEHDGGVVTVPAVDFDMVKPGAQQLLTKAADEGPGIPPAEIPAISAIAVDRTPPWTVNLSGSPPIPRLALLLLSHCVQANAPPVLS